MKRRVLFWDIDGTLLTTGRAGIFAWERACTETTGRELRFGDLKTAGLTDVEIAEKILAGCCDELSDELAQRLVAAYERYLPDSLPRRQGRVLDGVENLLRELSSRQEYVSVLLTGNTLKGARAKLDYYGLSDWFSMGSFSGRVKDRRAIASHAADLVRSHFGPVDSSNMFVIGDTPHDIKCGKSIGARTVAVATGEYGVDELRKYDPWHVMPEIGEAGLFLGLIDRGVQQAQA